MSLSMGKPIRIEYLGTLYNITSKGNERKHLLERWGPDKISLDP